VEKDRKTSCGFLRRLKKCFLIFYFLVPPRFISYFPLEGSISYSESSSMNLSCHAFAIPSVNITWIYKNKNKQIKSKIISSFLSIEKKKNVFLSYS
jgi:hypothetical protein